MNDSNTISNTKIQSVRPLLSVVLPFFIALLMISCGDNSTGVGNGSGNGNGNGNGNGEPGPDEVQMVGQSFSPSDLEVEVGTTVTWSNESSETHTVTSGSAGNHDGEFDSGNVAPGDTYSYTFDEVGTFPYFCIPHPNMTGTITVVE